LKHAFLHAKCPSCCRTNSVNATQLRHAMLYKIHTNDNKEINFRFRLSQNVNLSYFKIVLKLPSKITLHS